MRAEIFRKNHTLIIIHVKTFALQISSRQWSKDANLILITTQP